MSQPDFICHYFKPNLNFGETGQILVQSFKNLRVMNIHLDKKFLSPPLHHKLFEKYLNSSSKCA